MPPWFYVSFYFHLPPFENELHRISSILKYTAVTNALCLQQKAGMMQKKNLVLRSHEAVAMKYLSIMLSVEAHCTSMY